MTKLTAKEKAMDGPQKDWTDVKVMTYMMEVRGYTEERLSNFMRGWVKVKQGRPV